MSRIIRTITALVMGLILTPGLCQAQTIYPRGTTIREPGTYDGYTLFIAGDGIVYLIEMDGTIVNTWESPIPGHLLSSVQPLQDGRILAYSYPAGTSSQVSKIAGELDYDGNVLWTYQIPPSAPSSAIFHHDSERLANGNTLLLCSQSVLAPSISPITLKDDCIIEVDPNGVRVWSWFTWEHFHEFGFANEGLQLIWNKGGDWAHANSISVIPPNNHTSPAFRAGNIIVSQRSTNTIFIIDKLTGNIVWNLGPEDHETFGQHYPHMIPQGLSGAGNILVFDNGSGTGYPLRKTAPGVSRVHEIDPVTKSIVWSYDHTLSGLTRFSFFSNIVSSAERMPNGNTVICSGAKGRIFEINTDNALIWEYMSPFSSFLSGSEGLVVFRAYRLPYSWVP